MNGVDKDTDFAIWAMFTFDVAVPREFTENSTKDISRHDTLQQFIQ